MRADNSRHIRQAAERRHELTRSKAIAALRELENQGSAVTFEGVAAKAGVSRSWLYTQPDLRESIVRLRGEQRPRGPVVRPRDRASIESLQTRLAAAHERIRTLTEENTHLTHQLALALGQARQNRTARRPGPA